MRKNAVALWALCFVLLWPAMAQETPPAPPAPTAPTAAQEPPAGSAAETPRDLTQETLGLDIATADWTSLVSWVRSLGLAEDGGAQDLRQRLYTHYGVVSPPQPELSKRTIVIESADSTSYLSAQEGSQAYIRFAGGVSLVIKDDERGETIRLSADEILYNPDAGIVSARGSVLFERKGSQGTEWFKGGLLDLDLESQEGMFLDGRSERGSAQDRLTFRADDIASKGSGVLAFTDGIISSCDEDRPHYSIRASKIWILGGNEWAILNATLSVGEVPVLYLPFFYYPGEEIVFHPVFGYRPREGRFVQTTTYLLGEKSPKDQDISLFKLSESDGGAREVRGVFLRSTGEAAKPASSNFVKIMADLYAGLGTFAGVQAKLDSAGPFSAVSAFLGLGVSRSLFPLAGGTYSPFAEASDWQSQWNQSVLLGSSLPIRYALELSARLKVGPVAFGFSLPLYSDPFFDQDFRDRSEDMAWLKFLKQDKADSAAPSKKSSFSDRIDIQLSIPTSGLPVWLSTLSVGRLSSQLDWASKASRPVPATQPELSLYNADPSREFFYPLKLTLLDTSMSLGGTLLRLPLAEKARAPAPGSAGSDEFPLPEPVAPWASEKPQTPVQKPDAQAVSPGLATTAELSQPSFSPPPLAKAPAVGKEAEPSMSISWSMNPQGRWDVLFLDPAWLVPSDIDWRIKYELRSFRTSGALSLGAQYPASLLDWKLNLSGSTQAQWHANPSSDSSVVSAADLDRWKLEDARYRSDRLAAALSLRATPFASSWMWSASSLSYSLDASLYDYVFKSMDGDSPLYDSQLFSWTRDKVRSHALSALISARPFNLVQSIGVQISLPPLPESYVGRLDLRFPIATFGLTTKAQRPQPEAPLVWDPLGAQLNLAYGEWPSLGANFVWDIEGEKPSSLSTRLAWKGLSAELAFRQASELGFTPGSGWQSTGPEEFQPVSLSMAYSLALKPAPLWKSRINWSLNASLNARQSFVRFTDSTLDVTVGLSFKVHEFLDLQFSSTSRNASLWRYYPDLFSLPAGLDPEPVNPFVDLAKSFNFFDIQDRRESLFKLKSVSIRAVHYLHDWNLTLELTLRPVLDQATLSYQLRTSFSLLLAWISVPEFKASYKKDGSTETWN